MSHGWGFVRMGGGLRILRLMIGWMTCSLRMLRTNRRLLSLLGLVTVIAAV